MGLDTIAKLLVMGYPTFLQVTQSIRHPSLEPLGVCLYILHLPLVQLDVTRIHP